MPRKLPDISFDTQSELATWLGVSPSSLQYWRTCGAPLSRRGKYSLRKVLTWYFKRQTVEDQGDPDPLMRGNSPALERYREARADLAEHELREKTTDQIDADQVSVLLRHLHQTVERLRPAIWRKCGGESSAGKPLNLELANAVVEMIDDALLSAIEDAQREIEEMRRELEQ